MGKIDRTIIRKRFGSFTVLDSYVQVRCKGGTKTKWLCRCDCGKQQYVYRDQILKRTSMYCSSCRPSGIRNQKLYHVYYGIKQRCYNKNNPKYYCYGNVGITMCEQWLSNYNTFKTWAIANGYKQGLTIDRIDPTKNYSPQNCHWISRSQNSIKANIGKHKNKTKLKQLYAVSPNGQTIQIKNIKRFAAENGLNISTVSAILHGRCKPYYRGWFFHSNKTAT